MTSPNGLICFTNCLLPTEDGSLVEKDLWIDERRGVVLDSQVCVKRGTYKPTNAFTTSYPENVFLKKTTA